MRTWSVIITAALVAYIAACLSWRPRGTILTSTTYFDFEKENHWHTFCEGVDSILRTHSPAEVAQIDKWLVVNEWSAAPKADWAVTIQGRYPFIEFVQKMEADKGQARSLNMILERIRPYEFWIHWEESWFSARAWLGRAMKVMRNTDIDQLQLTTTDGAVDWKAQPRNVCAPDHCIVHLDGITMGPYISRSPYDIGRDGHIEYWPAYSLRPSINRTALYGRVGAFSEDPVLWPGRFEWDYGVRWYCARGVKGILPDGPVTRSLQHVSTYAAPAEESTA